MTTKALQTELSFIFGEVNGNKGSADRTVIYIWGDQRQQRHRRQNWHLHLGRSMTTKALHTELSFIFGEVNDNKGTADRTVIYIWGGQ